MSLGCNLDRVTGDTLDRFIDIFSYRKTYFVTVSASSKDTDNLPSECYPFYKPEVLYINSDEIEEINAEQKVGNYLFSHWESSFTNYNGSRNLSITFEQSLSEGVTDGWITAVYRTLPLDTIWLDFDLGECNISLTGAEMNANGSILIHKDSTVLLSVTANNGYSFIRWESSFQPLNKLTDDIINLTEFLPQLAFNQSFSLKPIILAAPVPCDEKLIKVRLIQDRREDTKFKFSNDLKDILHVSIFDGFVNKDFAFPNGSDEVSNEPELWLDIHDANNPGVYPLTLEGAVEDYEIYIKGPSLGISPIYSTNKIEFVNNTFTINLTPNGYARTLAECADEIQIIIKKKPTYIFIYEKVDSKTPAIWNNLIHTVSIEGLYHTDLMELNEVKYLPLNLLPDPSINKFPHIVMGNIGSSNGPIKEVTRISCYRVKSGRQYVLKPNPDLTLKGRWDDHAFTTGTIDQTTKNMTVTVDRSIAVQHLFVSKFHLLSVNVFDENGNQKTLLINEDTWKKTSKETGYLLDMKPRDETASQVAYDHSLLRFREPLHSNYRYSYTEFEFVFSKDVDIASLRDNLYIEDVLDNKRGIRIDGETKTKYDIISQQSSSNKIIIRTIDNNELECPHMSELSVVVNDLIRITSGETLDLFGYSQFKRTYETETPRITITSNGRMAKWMDESRDELVFQVTTSLFDNTKRDLIYDGKQSPSNGIRAHVTNQLPWGYTASTGDYITLSHYGKNEWRTFPGQVTFLDEVKINKNDALVTSLVVTEIDWGDVSKKAQTINNLIDDVIDIGKLAFPEAAVYLEMGKKIKNYVKDFWDNDDVVFKNEILISRDYLWGCDRLYKQCEVIFPKENENTNGTNFKSKMSSKKPRYLMKYNITLD